MSSFVFDSCKKEDNNEIEVVDTDGDGLTDDQELEMGTNRFNACDPVRESGYTGYDPLNTTWLAADCDQDGLDNGEELANDTNPYFNELAALDTDGDGITDLLEIDLGSDETDPCDPVQDQGYTQYDSTNANWATADCDGDGELNADELALDRDPYFNELTIYDTDGDGMTDFDEIQNGFDVNSPCDPAREAGYTGFDEENEIWAEADCDEDGILNADELSLESDPYLDERVFPTPEFLPTLSEINLFDGNIADLRFNSTVHEYSLSTPLFTDYSYKLRSIALPKDTQMAYNGEGLLEFPDNTIITKTFYYLNDERNPGLGRRIIETRLLIKKNGSWEVGNYIWNASQTEAFLDPNSQTVTIDWIDIVGASRTVDYVVPSITNCFQCHDNSNTGVRPIGPKARAINHVHNGMNQIEYFVEKGLLTGAPDVTSIAVLPDWSDNSYTLEERARAYLDMNCAHCHQPGGSYPFGNFEFRYETSFEDSNIFVVRDEIRTRVNSDINFFRMPLIGTTIKHVEGVDLLNTYIDSLE